MDATPIVATSKCFINIIAKQNRDELIYYQSQEQIIRKNLGRFFQHLIIDGKRVSIGFIENQENDNNFPTMLFPISFVALGCDIFDDFNSYGRVWRRSQVGNFKNLSDKNDQIIEAFRKYMADHLDEIKPGLGAEYRKMLFNNLIAETKITAEQIGRTTYGMETKFNRIKNILDNKTKIQANVVDATQQLLKK